MTHRNGFLLFISSCLSGCGQMYQGYNDSQMCQNLSFGQQSLFLVENGMKQIIRIDNTLHQNIRTALTHDAYRFARRFILVFNMQRLHIFGIFL